MLWWKAKKRLIKFSLLPRFPLSLLSRNKISYYKTSSLLPPKQTRPKRRYVPASTMPSRSTQKGPVAGTRDPTKHASIAKGPITVKSVDSSSLLYTQPSPQGSTLQIQRLSTHVTVAQLTAEQLDHHIFSKGEWKRVRFLDHPRVPVTILLMRPRRTGGNTECTTSDIHAEVSAIHETGPQLDLWSLTNFLAYSFSCYELCPICFSLSVANQSPITIEEAFFAKLTTESHDSTTA